MVDFRAFSILDAIMPGPGVGSDPFRAGVFYQGTFIDDQFVQTFTELFADERLAIFVTISAKPDISIIAMRHSYVGFTVNNLRPSYGFFFVNTLGQLVGTGNIPAFTDRTIGIVTSSIPPTVLVFTDQNGAFRYITANPTTLAWTASGTKPTNASGGALPDSLFQFFGAYLDLVGQDGQSIYRLTVNSNNNVSLILIRSEPQRNMPVYISSGHRRPYRDGHLYIGYLDSLGDIDTSIEQGEANWGGISIPRLSVLTINLEDGYFDYIVNQSWDTRDVEVSAGLTTWPFAEYRVILRTKTDRAEWDLNKLKITMIDQSVLFNRSIQTRSYAGTGGLEGSAEVKGLLKPLALGHVRNVTPVLLDRNLNLYQVHDGSFYRISLFIREGASAHFLHFEDTNLLNWQPTQEDVNNAVVHVDHTRGFFRLSAPPESRITCSLIGDTAIPDTSAISDIIRYIIQSRIPEASIDNNSFDLHKTQLAQYYGIYITEQTTIGDVIKKLAAPTGELISLTRLNNVRIVHLARGTARAFITDNSISEGSSIQRRSPPTPGSRYRLGFNKSSTVFTETDFLGNVVLPHDLDGYDIKHVMQNEYLWNEFTISGPDRPGMDRYDSAKSIDLPSYMRLAHNDLLVEVAIRDYSHRDLYDITVIGFTFFFELGDTILLQLDRWGLNVPRTMIIIGLTEMAPTGNKEDQTRLLLWG